MNIATEEQIRRRAYEIYRRHGKPGQDLQNWLEAEQELKQKAEHETGASVGEDTSTRRGMTENVAIGSSRRSRQEYQKGF